MAAHQNIAAVFAENLATHRQTQAGSPGTLAAYKWFEDVGDLLRRDADTVIDHQDQDPLAVRFQTGSNAYLRVVPIFHRIERVGYDIQQGPVQSFGIDLDSRQFREFGLQLDAHLP